MGKEKITLFLAQTCLLLLCRQLYLTGQFAGPPCSSGGQKKLLENSKNSVKGKKKERECKIDTEQNLRDLGTVFLREREREREREIEREREK